MSQGYGSAVERRQRRALAMVAEGRNGDVWRDGDLHRFVIDSTQRERTGHGKRYVGWVRTQRDRLLDGECSCPDWQKGGAQLGALVFCKHVGWAALKVGAAPVEQALTRGQPHLGDHGRADAVRRHNQGVDYAQQGRLDDAIREFQAALRIDPSLAMAHYNLGLVYDGQRRWHEVIGQYEAALRIDPGLAAAHYRLGVAHEREGHLNQAIRQYEAALRINASDADVQCSLGVAYYKQRSYDKAMSALQTATRLGSSRAQEFLHGKGW